MLRITQIDSPGQQTLKLEGKLLAAWVDELRIASEPLTRFAGRRALDLSDLTFADDAGVRLLHELSKAGIRIVAASQFVSELLQKTEVGS
jgi:hypothetical protein